MLVKRKQIFNILALYSRLFRMFVSMVIKIASFLKCMNIITQFKGVEMSREGYYNAILNLLREKIYIEQYFSENNIFYGILMSFRMPFYWYYYELEYSIIGI